MGFLKAQTMKTVLYSLAVVYRIVRLMGFLSSAMGIELSQCPFGYPLA